MRTLKLLREMSLDVEVDLADASTTAEAARLLSNECDTQEFLSSWLSEDSHAAFRIGNQMVWTFRALGRPVMVHWTFTGPKKSDTLEMKVYAYEEDRDAYRDACRLTLRWVLDDEDAEIRHLTGWQKDVVMLVRGSDFYIIRTHHTGEVEVSGSEEVALAYGEYVEAVNQLSQEIEFKSDLPGLSQNAMYPRIAAAFLQREAGQALQEYARHCLSLGIDGANALQRVSGQQFNMSELARSLHTDRPNLTRYQGKSSMAEMTPEKLEWLFGGDTHEKAEGP